MASGCAQDQQPEALVAADMLREGDAKPGVRIENDDGTFSYAIDPADVPVAPLVRGALTYAYVGQARYGSGPPGSKPRPYTIGGQRETPLEELYDSVRTDALGRQWEVIEVDRDLACITSGQEPESCDLEVLPPSEPIEEGLWTPHSWSFASCPITVGTGSSSSDETIWGVDDRNAVGSSFTDRQKPTVALYFAEGQTFATKDFDYTCSATVIGPHHVITAAHCVTKEVTPMPGVEKDAFEMLAWEDFRICTRGNLHQVAGQSTCTSAIDGLSGYEAIEVHPLWLTNGLLEWDIAVIEVVADLESYVGRMRLSNALPLEVVAADLHQTGYPIGIPGPVCASNVTLVGTEDPQYNGVGLFHQTGGAFDASPQVVRTRMDGSTGHSGGSLYKCAGGTCELGEPPWLVAVWSGFFESPADGLHWSGGASVPGHQTWITNRL